MVNEKSLSNLKKGNKKNTGRKAGSGGKTWAELIREVGEQPSKVDPTKTNKQLVVEQAYTHAALGNAAILRELMQRSEPQDTNIVVKKMSDDELRNFIAEQIGNTSNGD